MADANNPNPAVPAVTADPDSGGTPTAAPQNLMPGKVDVTPLPDVTPTTEAEAKRQADGTIADSIRARAAANPGDPGWKALVSALDIAEGRSPGATTAAASPTPIPTDTTAPTVATNVVPATPDAGTKPAAPADRLEGAPQQSAPVVKTPAAPNVPPQIHVNPADIKPPPLPNISASGDVKPGGAPVAHNAQGDKKLTKTPTEDEHKGASASGADHTGTANHIAHHDKHTVHRHDHAVGDNAKELTETEKLNEQQAAIGKQYDADRTRWEADMKKWEGDEKKWESDEKKWEADTAAYQAKYGTPDAAVSTVQSAHRGVPGFISVEHNPEQAAKIFPSLGLGTKPHHAQMRAELGSQTAKDPAAANNVARKPVLQGVGPKTSI